ncbi:hypothetical protein H0H92_012659 [Tricholoma furcatifolium]|nr:hypothetical protein H0H92_012659 [Tricholoma furcatifolium]
MPPHRGKPGYGDDESNGNARKWDARGYKDTSRSSMPTTVYSLPYNCTSKTLIHTSTSALAQRYGGPVAAQFPEVLSLSTIAGYSLAPPADLDPHSDEEQGSRDSDPSSPGSPVDLEPPTDPQAAEVLSPPARRGRAALDISFLMDVDDEQGGGSPAPQAHLDPPIAAPQGASHRRALVTPPPTESGVEYPWDYVYRYPQRLLAHAPADLPPSAAPQANAEVLSPIAGRGRAAMDIAFICEF